MKLRLEIISTFILFLFGNVSNAQQPKDELENNYQVIHWGMEQGLQSGRTSAFIKDTNGFLWIGTPIGLSRFDGKNFNYYFHDKNNPGTISDDFISNLVEDSLHNIWIGTAVGL